MKKTAGEVAVCQNGSPGASGSRKLHTVDDGEHSVAPSPLLISTESRYNLAGVPDGDQIGRSQKPHRETAPLERSEVGHEDGVHQVESRCSNGREDVADDV